MVGDGMNTVLLSKIRKLKKATPPPAEGYVRPADWLPLPKLTEGDQKIVGLYAVWPHDSNFCTLQILGDYTVDWGDSSSPENYDSGDVAYHVFDYDDLEGTECTRGYRQAIVTVTPQLGADLTLAAFWRRYNLENTPYYGSSTAWLDVAIVGESFERIAFGPDEWTLAEDYGYYYNYMLEQFQFIGSNLITSFVCMFLGCSALQSILLLDTSSGTDFSEMFVDCNSLQSIPLLDTSSGTNFSNMFIRCYSLKSIPLLDTSSGTDFMYMFEHCEVLQSIPLLDTSSGTEFDGMFAGCYALSSIPLLNVSNGIDFSYMFSACKLLSQAALNGTSASISYGDLRLSRQALIDIFNGLASSVTGKIITIKSNWGTPYLTEGDKDIARNKGWTVITE